MDEKKAAGRGRGACGAAVACCEDRGNRVGGDAVYADFEEGADQIANHVVEKSGAGHVVDKQLVSLKPLRFEDGASGRCRRSGLLVGDDGFGS